MRNYFLNSIVINFLLFFAAGVCLGKSPKKSAEVLAQIKTIAVRVDIL